MTKSEPPGKREADTAATTRATFLKYGAAGVATAGLTGAGLSRLSGRARAQAPPNDGFLRLFVNEGFCPMVDGSLVYMRGFGDAETSVSDARPSLTITPRIFKRGGALLTSRCYPADAALPPKGAPSPAGIDPSGPSLHYVRKRYWASYFPDRTIVAETGSTIKLKVKNRLGETHRFAIEGVVDRPVAPGATEEIVFAAPAPGTYLYTDTESSPVNRSLGLHGVLVVMPTDIPGDRWRLTSGGAEFERQWVWIMNDIDPEWGRLARQGVPIDPEQTPALPRYFTLNGRSGVFSTADSLDVASNLRTLEDTKPAGHGRKFDVRDLSKQPGQLIRLVNAGLAAHQPHFHGNHVWALAANGRLHGRSLPKCVDGRIELQHWEDVVELNPNSRKDVMLPIKPPPDVLDVVLRNQKCDWIYPMHCHTEMSQTAAGGLYPGGIVTDWIFKP